MSLPEMTTGGLRPPGPPAAPGDEAQRPSERLVELTRRHVQVQRRRGGEPAGLPQPHAPIDLDPATAHEAVTREMVLALQREVTQLRVRLDALFYLMVGSVLLEVLLRLIGRG